MTERAQYSFTVKEFADGTPWIAFEPLYQDIRNLPEGILGFDLPEGTSIEKAEEIASYLDANIDKVSFTKF